MRLTTKNFASSGYLLGLKLLNARRINVTSVKILRSRTRKLKAITTEGEVEGGKEASIWREFGLRREAERGFLLTLK